MRHLLLLAALLTVTAGCSAHAAPRPSPRTEIVIDRSVPQDALAPWLAYAGSRSVWMEKKFFERNPGAAAYRYTFAEELEAREACARVWSELRAKSGTSDRYLDDLVAVQKAGLLQEYTWVFFRDAGWSPPEGLRLAEFDRWRQEHLKEHRPETKALARFRKK
ncbi:MAG: hypothetical protein HYV05_08515 [Deltaproteobacteria bacterium]|nr:hypothetical protein [Deltaproteobacteria bacterium]